MRIGYASAASHADGCRGDRRVGRRRSRAPRRSRGGPAARRAQARRTRQGSGRAGSDRRRAHRVRYRGGGRRCGRPARGGRESGDASACARSADRRAARRAGEAGRAAARRSGRRGGGDARSSSERTRSWLRCGRPSSARRAATSRSPRGSMPCGRPPRPAARWRPRSTRLAGALSAERKARRLAGDEALARGFDCLDAARSAALTPGRQSALEDEVARWSRALVALQAATGVARTGWTRSCASG